MPSLLRQRGPSTRSPRVMGTMRAILEEVADTQFVRSHTCATVRRPRGEVARQAIMDVGRLDQGGYLKDGHRRTVPSALQEAKVFPSGENTVS